MRSLVRRSFLRAYFASRNHVVRTVVIDNQVHFPMRLDLGGRTGRMLYYLGYFERRETEVLLQLLRSGQVVLDVGANIGYYTLLCAKLVGPTGRVFSFEPVPAAADVLKENVALNAANNVTVVEAAVSDRPGTLEVHLHPTNMGAHSMAPIRGAAGAITVPVVRIDDFLAETQCEHVDVVKIDVEGAELQVLRGMRKFLSGRHPPTLLVEINPRRLRSLGNTAEDILRFLSELGYRISRVEPWWSPLRSVLPLDRWVPVNIVAVPERVAPEQ